MSGERDAGDVFATVTVRLAGETEPTRRVETLLLGLADLVKATSNDQNVQRLARDLRASAGELAGRAVRP